MMIYVNAAIKPRDFKPTHGRSHVALIAQLVEHCTGNAKVVGSNPAQSRNCILIADIYLLPFKIRESCKILGQFKGCRDLFFQRRFASHSLVFFFFTKLSTNLDFF